MLANKIQRLVAETCAGGDVDQIELDTPLLELNFLDSSALFDLVDLLNREADVVIPLREVTPNNFGSVQAIIDLVERLQSTLQA
ncbi:acyl carrier protein [Methylosinus sp. Sm6]|uniref:acyl carrier protein n=1 Tax=Methylosinus sp. Sm6 TaxID=2866948 RepID=UPI001C99E58D|nr:acyl carrier protein [Methylosinus sp. Sm6]MBY6243037.1 acyl carrier protein [Methylosinus sp. Sm6]